MGRKKIKNGKVDWQEAPDIKRKVLGLVKALDLSWIEEESLHCFRSKNSKSRAYARIWGLSRIWQKALSAKPAYIIEVLAERFDKLGEKEQNKVLLHEIAHIPKNYSGALLPHIRKKGKRNFEDRVENLFKQYIKKR